MSRIIHTCAVPWSGDCRCTERSARRRRAVERAVEHDTWDYHCEKYVGHNAVPRGVDVYERRCVVCNPYDDAEADALLRSES